MAHCALDILCRIVSYFVKKNDSCLAFSNGFIMKGRYGVLPLTRQSSTSLYDGGRELPVPCGGGTPYRHIYLLESALVWKRRDILGKWLPSEVAAWLPSEVEAWLVSLSNHGSFSEEPSLIIHYESPLHLMERARRRRGEVKYGEGDKGGEELHDDRNRTGAVD